MSVMEKTEVICFRDLLLDQTGLCHHESIDCETCSAILINNCYRSLEVRDPLEERFCFIEHPASSTYVVISPRSGKVYLDRLRDKNRHLGMFTRHHYFGYSDGNAVTVVMFSSYAKCKPSKTFVSAMRSDVFLQEYRDEPMLTGNSLNEDDPRMFISQTFSPNFTVFQLATFPGHYLAYARGGQMIIKAVQQHNIQNDPDIQFRLRFPSTCFL